MILKRDGYKNQQKMEKRELLGVDQQLMIKMDDQKAVLGLIIRRRRKRIDEPNLSLND